MDATPAHDQRRPALIVGTAPRLALAVARSLAARGIAVYAVPSSADEGAIATRSVARYFALPDLQTDPRAYDEGLLRIVERTNAGVVFPCSDTALAAIGRIDAALRERAAIACPPPDVVARVLDKSATIGFAQTLEIDVPETYEVGATSTPSEAAALMAYPVIAKPRNHAKHGGYRIRYFTGPERLEEAFADDPDFESRYLVQQFVPGVGIGVAALMHDGDPLAVFVHRRIKELPASGGVSVVSEAIAPDARLVDKAIALLRAIGWEGVALVEFRRAADGVDWLMEVNGRFWGTLPTAIAAGVDFPFMQWEVIHGRMPGVPAAYAVGLRMRWTRGAVLRLRERLFEPTGFGTPRLRRAQEWRSFREDFARGVRDAMWSWREPLPAINDAAPAVARLAASAFRAIVKPLVPRRIVRARRRFGTAGALGYAWFSLLRSTGVRSDALRRPFAPRSVLFVCTGNIMRSVFGAAAFKAALHARGDDGVFVDSAGLRATPGLPADRRTIAAADAAGLDVRAHRTKRVDAVDVATFDAVVVMDRLQQFEIRRRFPAAAARTYLLGCCLPRFSRVEIADPDLLGDDECAAILALVRERAEALAKLAADDAGRPS